MSLCVSKLLGGLYSLDLQGTHSSRCHTIGPYMHTVPPNT